MPKLIAVYEYRFVRPEDVREDDMVIDENTPINVKSMIGSPHDWKERAKDYARLAHELRRRAAELRAEGQVKRADEMDAMASNMEGAAPTPERTVCVRRRVR